MNLLGKKGLDATRIGPKLYVGSAPPDGALLSHMGFDTLVLCAEEYQPDREAYPGVEIMRVPIDDSELLPKKHLQRVLRGASEIARRVSRGERVLVTCMMGRNRSALVCAVALHLLTGLPGAKCAAHVRRLRIGPDGVRALQNDYFVELLRELQ